MPFVLLGVGGNGVVDPARLLAKSFSLNSFARSVVGWFATEAELVDFDMGSDGSFDCNGMVVAFVEPRGRVIAVLSRGDCGTSEASSDLLLRSFESTVMFGAWLD